MEWVLIAGLLYIMYQGGMLSSLGIGAPRQYLPPQQYTGQVPNYGYTPMPQQTAVPNPGVGIASSVMNALPKIGNSLGAFSDSSGQDSNSGFVGAAGGPAGAAVGAISQVISSIFAGMAARAQEATVENGALNYAVQGFDQALGQINNAYNSGQIDATEAVALVQSAYQQFWQVQAPKIQPNRNGCANGSACPGTAFQYNSTRGVPSGYCANNIGATCCIGCGPIRLSVERILQVLQVGRGTTQVEIIGGDNYGLVTRPGYALTWQPIGAL
jgi:hypothetical protein